jgi:flagellar motor protein MotB
MYFLALLLTAFLPLTAQDVPEKESGETVKAEKEKAAESSEEVKEEEKEADKEKASEEKKDAEAEEKKEAKAEEKKEAEVQEKPVKEEKKEEVVADATLKIEDEKEGKDAEDEEKDKDPKKFSVSVTNGFSHGVAKERKSFAYILSICASYQLPWKIGMNASVGLNALYRYDLEEAAPMEDGTQATGRIDDGVFDGTPLNIGFSRAFPLFWDIGSSIGINVALPFTSTELWEQYNIYTMLNLSLGARRAFKVAKETSITFGIGFSYTKTFAKEDYAWDDLQNDMMSPIQEHSLVPGVNLAFKYKDLGLSVGGSLNIGKLYSSSPVENYDYQSSAEYQEWHYGFSFRVVADYSIKDWNLMLGVMTNAPEKESGNYVGYDTVAGDPEVKDPSANYPFKGKYTRVFANIGYSYSF